MHACHKMMQPDLLEPLIKNYPFNPYRHYRLFTRSTQTAVLLAELDALPADASIHAAEVDDARAVVVSRRLSWDSWFFGIPMARIDYIFGDRGPAAEAALDACLEAFCREGIRHVSARIDGADNEAANLLENRGFRLMGGSLVYTARPIKERPRRVRIVGRIRPFDDHDGEAVVAIAKQAFANLRGRFQMDSNLPRERVDAFYGEWARRCVAHQMADAILVSEAPDGRLLGFVAFRRREPVSTNSGVPIFGNGLAACRPESPGAYPGLLHHAVAWIHSKGGVAEAQTQSHNAAAIAVHEAVGMRLRQSHHDLSAWLAHE
jgi:RimJ/RimL family protein N-acetyltransferase